MVRFCCEHCGHKISVQDEHAGKRGKCRECGSVFVVPAESTLIEFGCQNCGQKISVPKTYEGKEAKCPKCKNRIVVPARIESPEKSVSTIRFTCSTCKREIQEPESSRGKLIECPHCKAYVPVPLEETAAQKAAAPARPGEENNISGQHFEQLQTSMGEMPVKEPDHVAERKLPWIFDIFLYPSSKAGLTTLAIIIVIPLLIRIVLKWLGEFAGHFPPALVLLVPLAFIGIIVKLLLSLYLYWYFCECIRDSAAGGVRAPETLANTPGLGDLLWQWLRTIGCLVVFAAPTSIYYGYAQQTDTAFWALLAFGVFFFPMGLLAVVMFDSFAGINPILLIGSVFRTFLPYCAMTAILALAGFLIAETSPDTQGSAILSFIVYSVSVYLSMIAAHLLGSFYHRHEEKLNWGV
jgi:DNA-directed RNA polymerase subunit RPC12/RpoP